MSLFDNIFRGVFNTNSYNNASNVHDTDYKMSQSLSFPSSTTRGKQNLKIINDGTNDAKNVFVKKELEQENFTQKYIDRIPSMNWHMTNELKRHLLFDPATIELDKFGKYANQGELNSEINSNLFENPWEIGGDLLRSMNWYRFKYKIQVRNLANIEKSGSSAKVTYSSASITPSLFNPKFGVLSKGLTWNVPLLNDTKQGSMYGVEDVSDCSIRNLVALSHKNKLGAQRYRYADFMYCKDLGKVSNNHLITLRKFAFPVGDVIGEANAPEYAAAIAQEPGYMAGDDIARMIAWFDTDDNKLEDILTFQYEYTWLRKESQAQQFPSQENDTARGAVGLFANLNADNFRHMEQGTSGPQNLWTKLLGSKFSSFNMTPDSNLMEQFRNYDNNKVYTQKQAVQEMYIPEGKLQFNQDINLTFSYKLRAYDNINPKSAFLDLLGNILECTYFRGSFWGGSQSIIGPKPNNASYYKVNAFLDNAWDKVGGALSAMAAGTDSFGSVLGVLSGIAGEAIAGISNAAKELLSVNQKNNQSNTENKDEDEETKRKTIRQKIGNILKGLWDNAGLGQASKAAVQNALGRPAFYAFDSLLTGEDTGLWHLTIGNPLNPIVSMGNMIMKNASIQHFGPLGIDDFPTEIKVKVTLTHARPRDLVQIGKMYTQGLTALYQTTNRHKWTDFYPDMSGTVTATVKQDNGEQTYSKDISGIDMDTARKNALEHNKSNQENQLGNENAKLDSSNETDMLINAGQLLYIQQANSYTKDPLNNDNAISAELSGTSNVALGQIGRDEYV